MPAEPELAERLASGDVNLLKQLFEMLSEAVTVRDLSGKLVFANSIALAQMGLSSVEELHSRPAASIMDDYIVEDEFGRRLTQADLPSNKLIRGEDAKPLLMRTVHRPTGRLSWMRLKSTPLYDGSGELTGAVTVMEDLTAVKIGELRTQVLAESGRILASSLDFEQTLLNVAQFLVPTVGDYTGVDLLDDSGRLQRVTARLADPRYQQIAAQLAAQEPIVPNSAHRFSQVLLTGTSLFFPEILDYQLATVARNADHLALLQQIGIRSYLTVPLRVPSRTIGLLTLATTHHSGRILHHDDLELVEQLGRRAAVAVENARLHTKLAGVAETLQRSLQPNPLPDIAHLDLAALYRPAETELRVDVGGDFYEFFEHHGVWYVILGDVTGKGVSAASITALMRHGARVACRSEPQPGKILARLSEALAQLPVKEFATAMCACIHPDHIVISSAGHPPAMLVAPDGSIREVPAAGPLLGAFSGAEWPEQEFELSPDELVVMYTDGVIEATGETDRYGIKRLRALLSANATEHPQTVLDRLEAELRAFSVTPAADDVAVLALRAKPAMP